MIYKQDQFDSIDLSDNEIVKLENFPHLNRLGTLLLNNNRITRINPNIGGTITITMLIVFLASRFFNHMFGCLNLQSSCRNCTLWFLRIIDLLIWLRLIPLLHYQSCSTWACWIITLRRNLIIGCMLFISWRRCVCLISRKLNKRLVYYFL